MSRNSELGSLQGVIHEYKLLLDSDAIKSAARMSRLVSSTALTSSVAALADYRINMKDLYESIHEQRKFSLQEYRNQLADIYKIPISSISSQIADYASIYQKMFAKSLNMGTIQSVRKNFANDQFTSLTKTLAFDISQIYKNNFDFSGMREVIEKLKTLPDIDEIIADTEYTKEDVEESDI